MSEAATDLKAAAEERYLNYALSVITARALPDVRDGLKPVQRRILYAMHEDLRLGPGARHRKSAAVVGEVLGKYHPHGDQAAYEAMVRMAQGFALRYPLVHGEGNFGSLDGDGAAAMRYTEARLEGIAEALLADLDQETVPFRRNYDATRDEPVVLPASLPQLLMNGSTGIAVGMATNIPPHNLGELVDALVAMIAKPGMKTKELLRSLKGPDFPTGGEILNGRAELAKIYESGQGAIRLRAEYRIEKVRGKRRIVVTSVPYGVNKATLVEAIAEQIIARKLPQVVDVRDESTEDVRVVLELKPDASEELAMAYLYKHTDLATNFNVNLTALVPSANPMVGQPARLSLAELCRHFLDFRLEIVTRRLEFEKRKLEERLHILDALATIHANLDKALRIIRGAESRKDAAEKLKKAFSFDDLQVNAILDLRLYQLARLEIGKVRAERRDKRKRLAEVVVLLKTPRKRWALIREELMEAKKKYGDPRRSRFARGGEELTYDPEAYVVHEETTIVVTRDGWVKRLRELKDPRSTRLREGDAIFQVLPGSTRDRLAVFSTRGGLYVISAKDVPATTGYGEPVASLFRFADGERLAAVFLVTGADDGTESASAQGDLFAPPVSEGGSYIVATAAGFGFRCVPDFSETTRAGRKVARVGKGDEIVSVTPVLGKEVVCAARRGKMLRFPLAEVAELSGPGKGVYLMRPGEAGDRIVGAVCPPKKGKVCVVPADGKERRLGVAEVPAGKRGGKGLKVVKRGTISAIRVDG